jgi:hypothetical protein
MRVGKCGQSVESQITNVSCTELLGQSAILARSQNGAKETISSVMSVCVRTSKLMKFDMSIFKKFVQKI